MDPSEPSTQVPPSGRPSSPAEATGAIPLGNVEATGATPAGDRDRKDPDPAPTTALLIGAVLDAARSQPDEQAATPAAGVPGSVDPDAAIEALPPTSALLVVRRGAHGARFLLNAERTTVGRHPKSDIFLDDNTVSRAHAVLERHGTEYWVHDQGSLNGTYVNGERVETARLTPDAELQVGKFRMTFHPSPSAQPAPSGPIPTGSIPPGPTATGPAPAGPLAPAAGPAGSATGPDAGPRGAGAPEGARRSWWARLLSLFRA